MPARFSDLLLRLSRRLARRAGNQEPQASQTRETLTAPSLCRGGVAHAVGLVLAAGSPLGWIPVRQLKTNYFSGYSPLPPSAQVGKGGDLRAHSQRPCPLGMRGQPPLLQPLPHLLCLRAEVDQGALGGHHFSCEPCTRLLTEMAASCSPPYESSSEVAVVGVGCRSPACCP